MSPHAQWTPRRAQGWRVPRSLRRRSANLWVLPAIMTALAVALARSLVWIDHSIPQDAQSWYLFGGQAGSARELLSTIAASLMTFTSVVFSVTILVLQLASQQFSPRVLRTFLENRFTRFALGIFIASFVCAMVLLPEVKEASPGRAEFVPALAVLASLALVLVCSAVFVQYIHHMAQSIRAVNIIGRVAEDALWALDRMCETVRSGPPQAAPHLPELAQARVVCSERSGVLAQIDEERLLGVAERQDLVIALVPKMGDFVPNGAPLLRVAGRDVVEPRRLLALLEISEERTPEQDPGFGFRQLVDIAVRALSPGVNDPTTAVQALDRIHDLLRSMAARRLPGSMRADSTGKVRLAVPRHDYASYVHLGFDEIRQYGRNSAHVTRRLRAILDDLESVVPPEHRRVVQEQRVLLEEARRAAFGAELESSLVNRADAQEA